MRQFRTMATERGLYSQIGATEVGHRLRYPLYEGKRPPIMEDARSNYLIAGQLPESGGRVYLKAAISPYSGAHGTHFLVIPDAPDGRNMPSIMDMSARDLGATLNLLGNVAEQTLLLDEIDMVDVGWHHSPGETGITPRQHQSLPNNLHLHIIGFPSSADDMHPKSLGFARTHSRFQSYTGDPYFINKLGEDIITNEIVLSPDLASMFGKLFEPMRDGRGRLSFKMRRGIQGFEDAELPLVLQLIDEKANEKYFDVARCFLVADEQTRTFKEEPRTAEHPYGRYELLPVEQRQNNVEQYIRERGKWLSSTAQNGLRSLAALFQDEMVPITRELQLAKGEKGRKLTEDEITLETATAADRFWAYKDLVSTMVWSAKKGIESDGKTDWVFRFDPSIFTVMGIEKAGTNATWLINRGTQAFTEEQLRATQARERRIIDSVTAQHPEYVQGPGIANR